MLTGNLVRVRMSRGRVIPRYIDVRDPAWLQVAEQLRALFRDQEPRTRGELQDDLKESFGGDPSQIIHQGLAKLLEDRCEFEVEAGHPPEQLRELVFQAAARRRVQPQANSEHSPGLDRSLILSEVGQPLGLTGEQVDRGLFADLKSEQMLTRFKDITPERLLQRYNVALAQSVLLRSTCVRVTIHQASPARLRQLLRQIKFHRLVCEVHRLGRLALEFRLDGPLSLFSATQKYGLQLALFLPAVLHCKDYALVADLRWGPKRSAATFTLEPNDGLVSHLADTGTYVPPELAMFVELFRKKVADWTIEEENEVQPLGEGFWVPDYRLTHAPTGRIVLLEVLGFWRRGNAERHLQNLREHARAPFLLAVSEQLKIDDAELAELPAGIHRFRQMPLPDEIARLAGELL